MALWVKALVKLDYLIRCPRFMVEREKTNSSKLPSDFCIYLHVHRERQKIINENKIINKTKECNKVKQIGSFMFLKLSIQKGRKLHLRLLPLTRPVLDG